MQFVSRNSAHPRVSWPSNIADGHALHGLSDGSWSFIDAVEEMLHRWGPGGIWVSTWTAATTDIMRAEKMLHREDITYAHWLVDRSFLTRQPRYCAQLRGRFGDDAIRTWNAHTKFCVLEGVDRKILYLTSANLNANKRVENWTLIAGGGIPDEYLHLVRDVFEKQQVGEGFKRPAAGRQVTDAVMGNSRQRFDGIDPLDQLLEGMN